MESLKYTIFKNAKKITFSREEVNNIVRGNIIMSSYLKAYDSIYREINNNVNVRRILEQRLESLPLKEYAFEDAYRKLTYLECVYYKILNSGDNEQKVQQCTIFQLRDLIRINITFRVEAIVQNVNNVAWNEAYSNLTKKEYTQKQLQAAWNNL